MIGINASKQLVNLNGETLIEQDKSLVTVGKSMSTILLNHRGNRFDQLKLLELARRFYKEGELEFDKADIDAFKEIVKQDQSYGNALIHGQLQEILISATEKPVAA